MLDNALIYLQAKHQIGLDLATYEKTMVLDEEQNGKRGEGEYCLDDTEMAVNYPEAVS